MIKIIPSTIGSASPHLFSVEICEKLCGGYNINNLPTATITAANLGSSVTAGGTTIQKVALTIVLTYQPCSCSSELKVKTFAEYATFSAPGAVAITPSVGSVSVSAPNSSCNRSTSVKLLTSVSIAYA